MLRENALKVLERFIADHRTMEKRKVGGTKLDGNTVGGKVEWISQHLAFHSSDIARHVGPEVNMTNRALCSGFGLPDADRANTRLGILQSSIAHQLDIRN